ncbi:MAG TPA: hypothetical protein VF472_24870 [Burkholderiaceae bacterium]
MLNWKAILAGAIVDFAGTYLATIILALLWMGALKLGVAADEAVTTNALRSPLFLAVSVTVGWYFDYLGGKIAGHIALKHANPQPIWHGLAAVIPGVVLALVDSFGSDDPQFPAWFMVACCAVSLVCGGCGAAQARPVQKPEVS